MNITAFHQACHNNSIEIAALFLERGIDVNLTAGDLCRTPLHYAATNPNPSLAFFEFLINKGADPKLLSRRSMSKRKPSTNVLGYLFQNGTWNEPKRHVIDFLLDHGADVNLDNKDNLLAALCKYNLPPPQYRFQN